MRVPANALFIVVVISLLCFILTAALINYSWLYKGHIYTERTALRLQHDIEEATKLVLNTPETTWLNKTTALDLFADGEDTVHIQAAYWGLFTKYTMQVNAVHDTLKRAFLKGAELPDLCKSAIYLQDRDRPLAISGKNIIKGPCYLPPTGIRKTFVEGDAFVGDQLVDGVVSKSSRQMPDIDSLRYNYLYTLAKGYLPSGMEPLQLEKEIKRSFEEKQGLIQLSGGGSLNNTSLQGNIIIHASGPITIGASCALQDVLVIAPAVKIEKGFTGKLQIIAWDSVRIESNAKLSYPSAVVLLKTTYKETSRPIVFIEAGAVLEGIVVSWQDREDQKRTFVTVEKDALVRGQILSNGMVCIKGTVLGNVSAHSFYYETKSTQYDNLLISSRIDYTALSTHFIGGYFLKTNKDNNSVLKWLY